MLSLAAITTATLFGVLALFRYGSVLAATGTNEQLNYQARLLTDEGAVVPDGLYNIRFRIYQDGDGVLGGGDETLAWTEARTGASRVTVKNGYFSIYLGSVTPFAGSVDWNQDTLWLSIDIGGTGGSPSYDGEMSPFTRLSSSPYALNSAQLGGLDSSQFVQLAQGQQTDSSTNASIYINDTAGGNLLHLLSGATDRFVVSNTGTIAAATAADTINGIIINAGAISGVAGFTQATGNFDFSGGGDFGVASSGLTVTTAGAITASSTIQGTILNATTGFRVNGTATAGQYLRGNGTNIVLSVLSASDLSGSIFNTGADSGSGTIVYNDTLAIQGGTNGIDTALSGDTFTLNLDTTEISTTTFGSGAGFIWTFDVVGTDPIIAFGNNTITLGSTTAGLSMLTTGEINDIDGNVVINDQVDIGSATTGLRVTTDGFISDVDDATVTFSEGITVQTGGASISGGLNNNSGNITNAGAISGATNITASGTIQGATINATSTFQHNGTDGRTLNCAATEGVEDVEIRGGILITSACRGFGLSDENLKENVASLSSVLDDIRDVNVVNFDFDCSVNIFIQSGGTYRCDETETQTGVIAQELELIFPDLVFEGPDGYKRVNYEGLSMYNLRAVQELANLIDSTGDASLNSVAIGGNTIISSTGSLQNVTGLTVISGGASLTGGIDNNSGGITETGAVSGVTTLSATGQISTSGNILTSGSGTITSAGLLTASSGATLTTGNLAITAGSLTTGGTERLSNAGALSNITGYSQSSGSFLQSGTGTFGTGTGAVSLNGATTVTGTNTFTVNNGLTTLNAGLTASGTITFGGLNSVGLVRTNASGVLATGALNRNDSSYFNTALTVANGGTGATTLTSNGVLFGNGTGVVQASSAGTGGQVLLANGSGIPTFTSISSDISISATGVATVQANSVALATDTTGNYVATVTVGNGLTVAGVGSENATADIDLDVTATGATSTTNTVSGLEAEASGLRLLGGCNNGQVLKWQGTTTGWQCNNDNTFSDSNLKTNVVTQSSVLNAYKNLRIVNYNYKCNDALYLYLTFSCDEQTGVIAQELLTVFPSLVTLGGDGLYRVNYQKLGLYTMKAVAELANFIDASGNATLSSVATGGTTRLTSGGALQNITGLTVTSGGATISSGNLAITAGSLSTAGTTRLSNGGALQNITGLTIVSGGADITGTTNINVGALLTNTNINTGASTGTTTIGGGLSSLVINSIAFDVTTTGNVSTPGNINVTGTGIYQINGTSGISADCDSNYFLGNMTVSGGIVTAGACEVDSAGLSDSRAKQNIVALDNSILSKIKNVNTVNFDFKCDDPEFADMNLPCETQTGVIAQQLAEVFPELVYLDDDGYYRVKYDALNIYTLKAVTEIAKTINIQDNRVVFNTASRTGLTIVGNNGTHLFAIDENGNATFNGTLTAQGSVNQTQVLATIDQQLANAFGAGIEVSGYSTFNSEVDFNEVVSFANDVILAQDVIFQGRPILNNDTGGFATIEQGDKEVRIEFEHEFPDTPVVNVSNIDGKFVNYTYKDLDETGFTVVLQIPAIQEVKFSWTAFAIDNALTQLSGEDTLDN